MDAGRPGGSAPVILVIRGEAGLLFSAARIDEQVKVSGVRVHPAEGGAQLNSHPAVAGAVVVGDGYSDVAAALTAYVSATRGHLRGGAEGLPPRAPAQPIRAGHSGEIRRCAGLPRPAGKSIGRHATCRIGL